MNETTTDTAPPRPSGWIVECPRCHSTWRVTRDELQVNDRRWLVCPTCVDAQGKRGS